jgi:hypothetical protein
MVELFVGSLVDYYCVRFGADSADRLDIGTSVRRWAEDLAPVLAPHLGASAGPLCVDSEVPPWAQEIPATSWRALQLLAAYAEQTALPWPDTVPDRLEDDPAWQRSSAGDFERTRFPQILIPDAWMPGEFAFTTRLELPDGQEWVIGSVVGLQQQLVALNAVTLQVHPQVAVTSSPAADFLTSASQALSLALAIAAFAAGARTAWIALGHGISDGASASPS